MPWSNKGMSLQSMVHSSGLQKGQIWCSPSVQSFPFGKRKATQPGHCRCPSWVMRSLAVLRQDTRARYLELKCCQSAAPFLAGAVILELYAIPVHYMDHLSWGQLHGRVGCLVMVWCLYRESSAVIFFVVVQLFYFGQNTCVEMLQ